MSPVIRVRARSDRRLLQLYYVDATTKKERTKSAGTNDAAEAERAAARWQQQLEKTGRIGGRISWAAFCDRVKDEYISGLAKKTGKGYMTATRHLTLALNGDLWLHEIDTGVLSIVQGTWRKNGMAETSITTHLRHLAAMFAWAKELRLISESPKIFYPKQTKRRLQRGRALTDKEFQSMVKLASDPYKRLLHGLWLSGLRINEAVALSWDSPPIRVDLDGAKFPRLVIFGEGQKSRKDEIVPITPDFAKFLAKTPAKQRTGPVFPLPIKCLEKIGKAIGELGKAANIVVNDKGKFASAQDLRSSFGTRWKRKVHPLTLRLMMRHRDLSTTMNFYIDDDADEAAEEIWGCTDRCTKKPSRNGQSQNGHPRKRREKGALARR